MKRMVNYGTYEDLIRIIHSDFERENFLNSVIELNYGCNGIN